MSIEEYFSDWRDRTWTCSRCSWARPGRAAAQVAFSELFELNCPNCDGRLATIPYPTHDSIQQAAAAGNAEAIGMLPKVHAANGFRDALRAARARLVAIDFPEGTVLTFRLETITQGDRMNPTHLLVLCNGEEVHREPSGFEHWEAIIEIGQFLVDRFGGRISWYDPDKAGLALLGDSSSAADRIRAFLAESRISPPSGPWAGQ